ncbi:putative bifunctional diguanylate cyclase/phosphodiesterase [Henriciella aquimarina]|uniref:putative bifunctional diguanylate cyclase/phosphodiesterase n=1 Tax=Henriciella aquimarina TaxID=545261 RepID=UPI0009FD8631|nr:EAL domain-containing protein [Henriciella aquimarina]
MLSRLRAFFSVKDDEPELNRARFRALSRQQPLMYGIITINMLALAFTHMESAPIVLTVIVPVMLLIFSANRTLKYVRSRNRNYTDAQIAASLRSTIRIVIPAAFAFAAWGLSFYQYGNSEQHAQVVFFLGVTTIASAFCLMHLVQAAISLLAIVSISTCLFLISSGDNVLAAIAFNLALVTIVFSSLLMRSERDFARLVVQKREQRRQHARLQTLNEENKRLANTDSLTGLANRRAFLAEIDNRIATDGPNGREFVIALLDLDGFKPINDVFGHPAGDQVLAETARRLCEVFKNRPVSVARLGGDEFGLLFNAPGSDAEIVTMAQRVCAALRRPFQFEEGSANLSATIGMARFPTAADTRGLLFDRADYALYFAKQNAKSRPVFFSHEHERLIFANSALEQALRDADLEKEMSVEFQPVLDLGRGQTRGLEALARWYSPTLGRIRPDLFIKAAENIGMIGRLTEVLFRKAVAEATQWPDDLLLSFNLSATSLTSKTPIQRLMSIAERAGLPTSRLMFEITESAVMKDYESAMDVLKLIQSTGAHVAIDDFGTGFSSLAYVHRLPIDTLKVDRSFIRDLTRNERSSNVLRSILSLCRNLRISCVIEGIETQEQFDCVYDLGARFVQGYYYSKPLSASDTHMVLKIEFESAKMPPGTEMPGQMRA